MNEARPGKTGAVRLGAADAPLTALLMLAALNAFNHLDRQVMSILLEPIRAEFVLSDVQLGLLSGLAFAAIYTILGLPAAVWAARHSRVDLVAASAALWGAMTVFCGMAQSFTQLLLGRIGVGVGEAGCAPAAQAMISDLYPPSRRATAMSVFMAGINVGVFLAFLVGGLVGQRYGWRTAFVVAGVPTVLLGLLLRFTVREPARDVDAAQPLAAPVRRALIRETLRLIFSNPVLRQTCIAATLTATVSYAALAWLPSFLARSHGMGIGAAGLYLAIVIGIGGAIGSWVGGLMSDRLGARDPRWSLWFVALVFIATKPLSIAFYLTDSTPLALALFLLPGIAGAIYIGPSIAVLHGAVPPMLRPVASAIFLFLVNFVGLGLGPLLVGALSQFAFAGAGEDSLGRALVVMQFLGVWGGVHFWLAGRRLSSASVR